MPIGQQLTSTIEEDDDFSISVSRESSVNGENKIDCLTKKVNFCPLEYSMDITSPGLSLPRRAKTEP